MIISNLMLVLLVKLFSILLWYQVLKHVLIVLYWPHHQIPDSPLLLCSGSLRIFISYGFLVLEFPRKFLDLSCICCSVTFFPSIMKSVISRQRFYFLFLYLMLVLSPSLVYEKINLPPKVSFIQQTGMTPYKMFQILCFDFVPTRELFKL